MTNDTSYPESPLTPVDAFLLEGFDRATDEEDRRIFTRAILRRMQFQISELEKAFAKLATLAVLMMIVGCGGAVEPELEPSEDVTGLDASSEAAQDASDAHACPSPWVACTLVTDDAGTVRAVLGAGDSCCTPP